MNIKGVFKLLIAISSLIFIFCISVYAEEYTFKCGTNPQLVQELHQELVEKKLSELNADYSPWSDEISLFSIHFAVLGKNYMPSTGDVKILTVPIEFKDEKFNKDMSVQLQKVFFEKHDIEKTRYTDLSVCDYFEKVSFNKLRLSGTVLPVYSVEENREYYEDRNLLIQEIAKAIILNKDIIGDLSEYDYDNNGYIDCLNVVWAGSEGEWLGPWWGALYGGQAIDLYNGKKMKGYVGVSEPQADALTIEHEIGHALGLPDNYQVFSDSCVLNDGTNELMVGRGYYINAFYRYLLDWEEPEIFPYEDIVNNVDLYASDIYNKNELSSENTRAVVFLPVAERFPFTEFYIAEYRTYRFSYKDSPGIIIWHCNPQEASSYMPGEVHPSTDYIKPVYKSNDETEFKNDDLYRIDNDIGNEWSSETTPSSAFYDDVYTGAYMKVLSMDDEKATIEAGFKNPDLSPAPSITISPPSKKAVKSGSSVTYTITYEDYTNIFLNSSHISLNTIGDVSASCMHNSNNNSNIQTITLFNVKGDGILGFSIPKNTAVNGVTSAPEATSEMIYVDNTPPEITLNGDSKMTIEQGKEYEDLEAKVTDNLDSEIESKLKIIGKVNTSKVGTYNVFYEVTDHAGNTAKVIRTVTVLAPTPTPTSTPSPTPTPTPSPTSTVEPTVTPIPTPTPTDTVTPTIIPTATPTLSPPPTVTPSPTPTIEPTITPTATHRPSDRVEFTQLGNLVSAKLIFEKTVPSPDEGEIQLYVAYKKDGVLKGVEMMGVTDMNASFVISKGFEDCEISVYVWDKDMNPLMSVQRME